MTFASKKDLQASRKFELVRINPSRYIVDDLVSIGGGKYTYTTSYFVNKVEESGALLTKASSNIVSIGEYFFDEINSLLYIYPHSLPSSTNPVLMYHYLFFTGEIYRTWYENPDDDTTPLRDWQPLLESSPSVTQSIEDLLAGVLSISVSNISILNNNYELNEYITTNDSFYNKEVSVWLCLDDETSSQKIFTGHTGRIVISKKNIVLDVRDPMSLLENTALMGDSISESYYKLEDNPSLYPASTGTPCTWIVGTCSRYQTLSDTASGLAEGKKLDVSTLYQATCINYNENLGVTTNRQWGICRTASAGFQDFTHTVLITDNTNPSYTRFTSSPGDVAKIFIGDTFGINYLSSNYYARVLYVDRVNQYIYTSKVAVSGTVTIQGNNCPSIVVLQDNIPYYLYYGLHYTATVTTTSGGNKLLNITLADDFESFFSINPLDPSGDVVYFRVRPARLLHGELVEKIISAAGLVIDSASVASANSLLPVYVSYSLPTFDESDFDWYQVYLQHLLSSVFGYIFLNNSFEIEYVLFADPSSTDQITDTEVLLDSYRVEVDYQDIVTQIIAYNPHANSVEFADKTGTSLNSPKAQRLIGYSKSTRFQHCLEDMTGRLPQILKYRSNRVAKYYMDTATKNLDSEIGTDFLLSKDGLLGELTKQVKLIGIEKKSNMTSLILTDLGV